MNTGMSIRRHNLIRWGWGKGFVDTVFRLCVNMPLHNIFKGLANDALVIDWLLNVILNCIASRRSNCHQIRK